MALCGVVAGVVLVGGVTTGSAQEAPPSIGGGDEPLRVFFDCDRCDFDYFRREAAFVDYVRDRVGADLHVLITSERTGGGGQAYAVNFIGLGDRSSLQDTLHFVSRQSDTGDEVRAGLIRTFKIGLMRYVAGTPAARQIDIRYEAPEVATQTAPASDPWNLWVFRARVSGEIEGESRQRSYSFDGSVSASRTTENLKIDIGSFGRYQDDRFELSGGDTIVSTSRNVSHEGIIVWSLGPQWSVGVRASALTSTRVNQDLTLRAAPAVEYNVYPYAESSRRQITFLYSVGIASFNYEEITLFDKTGETHPEQRLEISAQFQQPWGEVNSSLEGSTFLHDPSLHRIDLSARLEFRLMRGLNLNLRGSVARIKDQIYVARAGVSDEDVLLRRRQLGTDFEYSVDVGLSFTFGSVFNNVVNPRMGRSRERRFF